MYSQNKEEQYITDYFKGYLGSLLDIGAYDGKSFSNTLKLLEGGWSGVLIEPSPPAFLQLIENTKHLKNIQLLNMAVAAESKIMKFFDSHGDAISSIDIAHKEKWEKGGKCSFREFFIKTVTINEVLDWFGYDFDFINLDVESLNLEIFNKIPFEYLKNLKMFCIEHDFHIDQILAKIRPLKFKEIHCNAENLILVKC
jgi:FkbM family methyltransferase